MLTCRVGTKKGSKEAESSQPKEGEIIRGERKVNIVSLPNRKHRQAG